eukprot:COSAG01_NODE_2921_length_6846_cov_4.205276_5_plen_96_part_00
MLRLLQLKTWMKARGLKKSDKAKILAAFNDKVDGAAPVSAIDMPAQPVSHMSSDSPACSLMNCKYWATCPPRSPPTCLSFCTANTWNGCPSFVGW